VWQGIPQAESEDGSNQDPGDGFDQGSALEHVVCHWDDDGPGRDARQQKCHHILSIMILRHASSFGHEIV